MYHRYVVRRKPDEPLAVGMPHLDGVFDPIEHPVANHGVNVHPECVIKGDMYCTIV